MFTMAINRIGQEVGTLWESVSVRLFPMRVPLTNPLLPQAGSAYEIVQEPDTEEPICDKVVRTVPVVQPRTGAVFSLA